MTNIQKAIGLINTFATGDVEKAVNLLAEGYIQHNLAYGTGRDAFVGSVQYLASAPVKTTVNNIRAYEDGDKDCYDGKSCRRIVTWLPISFVWRTK